MMLPQLRDQATNNDARTRRRSRAAAAKTALRSRGRATSVASRGRISLLASAASNTIGVNATTVCGRLGPERRVSTSGSSRYLVARASNVNYPKAELLAEESKKKGIGDAFIGPTTEWTDVSTEFAIAKR
jgi:hypothetical protein